MVVANQSIFKIYMIEKIALHSVIVPVFFNAARTRRPAGPGSAAVLP